MTKQGIKNLRAEIIENKRGKLDLILYLDEFDREELVVNLGKLPKIIISTITIKDFEKEENEI